jgi:hypothetical protein
MRMATREYYVPSNIHFVQGNTRTASVTLYTALWCTFWISDQSTALDSVPPASEWLLVVWRRVADSPGVLKSKLCAQVLWSMELNFSELKRRQWDFLTFRCQEFKRFANNMLIPLPKSTSTMEMEVLCRERYFVTELSAKWFNVTFEPTIESEYNGEGTAHRHAPRRLKTFFLIFYLFTKFVHSFLDF